jgi:hypothetical protein
VGLFKREKKEDQWEGMQKGPPQGSAKLKQALHEKREETQSALGSFFGRGRGLSGRVLTAGEIILDWSSTPFGRVITAASALTLVWLLL